MTHIKYVLVAAATAGITLAAPPPKSGIEADNIDKTCKPCEDFWRYANGGWIDRNPIPAAQSTWGTFSIVRDGNKERLRAILESAASSKAVSGSNDQKIGDLYSSCMDTARRDALGVKPVQPQLDRIDRINSREELNAVMRQSIREGAGGVGVAFRAMPDLKIASEVVAYLNLTGISLPDRDYYLRDDERMRRIRSEFVAHIDRMFALAGIKGQGAGAAVLAFETSAAQVMKPIAERRDPYARYNKKDLAGLTALAPSFPWAGVVKDLGIPTGTPIIVSDLKVVEHFEKQLSGEPLDTWKLWLKWRALNAAAPNLSKPFEEEAFQFTGRVMTGAREQLPRWQRCTDMVDGALGEALGQAFVAKHFPPAASARMSQLVENLRATFREEIEKQEWMNAETRKNAITKLNAFDAKIGYPAKWRDYGKVTVKRDALMESLRSASLAARQYNLSKIGQPVDKNDWSMTPPTVNAYYNSTKNEIVFPAGILQPPFFDVDADDAANYGAIGAVIGHEMGHGFDDQGSKFDFSGNLKNWWTSEDRARFETRVNCVVDQFNTMDVGDGLRHNGRLVVGEALGDLGGLTLAYRAYKRSLNGKPAPVIDGYTGDQRFFLNFARVWATHLRPEALRMRLQTDPHPIARFRANGTLMNMPEFHQAFGCKLGDPMVRPPEKQCKLW